MSHERKDEFARRLLGSFEVERELETKTDAEIADLLYRWASDEDMFGPQFALLTQAVWRLRRARGGEWTESDECHEVGDG